MYKGTDKKPEYILHPEGIALYGGTSFAYQYNLTDHLGNVRSVLATNKTVEQTTDYFPFGLAHATANLGKNKYLYNGKELQNDNIGGTAFNNLDYGARFYDPTIARWNAIDPLAEKYYGLSPYNYVANNPMRFVDPDGRFVGDFLDEKGKYLGNDGLKDGKVYVIKTTDTNYPDNVQGAGLSKADAKATKEFITTNSGFTQAFQNSNIAYNNSIEMEGSQQTRTDMVAVVNQDNGKGGTSAKNNREFGGNINNNGVVNQDTPGAVANPRTSATANIGITYDNNTKSTFHSHPSGSVVDVSGTGMTQTRTTHSFTQSPSPIDISAAGNRAHYVFGRGNGTVYIYNSQGVQATIPQKYFVNPKR